MTTVGVGVSDPYLGDLLRSAVGQIPGGTLLPSGTEQHLIRSVAEHDPEVVVLDDRFGGRLEDLVWTLSIRRPICAVIVLLHRVDLILEQRLGDLGARLVSLPARPEELGSRMQTAAIWVTELRRAGTTPGPGQRGRVVALAGAKGGVGTTLIATHLALAAAVSRRDLRVCLVDLDVDKGDVPELLGISSRVTLGDLARAADGNLSATTVSDAVTIHDSGLHVLVAPAEIRDVEAITTAAVAEILRMLREQYDVVVIDAGSHVTTVQAAGVGLADEVFVVATPDLLCLRALKRVLRAWESVDVCEEPDVRILLNRVSRKSAVPVSDVARLVPAATVETVSVPASFRRLEESVNDRDPSLVRGRAWARAIMGITGAALAGVPGSDGSGGTSPVGDPALGGRRRARGDAGSVTIETVALIPKVLLAALLCWQVVLFAMSFVWAGHAADAAARAGARGGDADSAAKASVPPGFVDSVDATTSAGAVTVSFSVPVLAPGLLDLPFEIESTRRVVEEPS